MNFTEKSNFFVKYLKYKIKYLNLKKIGSGRDDVAVGSIVESMRGEYWGIITRDLRKAWLFDNKRIAIFSLVHKGYKLDQ
tara:strand:- start:575 stop:814 length:240 start_codon:yes stop_codon:yes gene_type:complete